MTTQQPNPQQPDTPQPATPPPETPETPAQPSAVQQAADAWAAAQAAEAQQTAARPAMTAGPAGRGMWAVGLTLFAGIMMIVIGIFQALEGLAAILDDSLFVTAAEYAYDIDVSAWGWIHLIGGIIVAVAGWFVLRGALWARIVGMVVAALSAIANFFYIPYYPVWSILIIALDVVVIWALATYRHEAMA